MKVYEIIEERGCGDIQCPYTYHSMGLLYYSKETAKSKANELWLKNTTPEERKDSWCYIHYTVREREVL